MPTPSRLTGVTASQSSTARSSATISFACPSGDNRALVVWVNIRMPEGIEGVTYGGNALTLAAASDNTGDNSQLRTWCYYLLNPPAGTADVFVDFETTVDPSMVGVFCLGGVDPADPIGYTTFERVVNGLTITRPFLAEVDEGICEQSVAILNSPFTTSNVADMTAIYAGGTGLGGTADCYTRLAERVGNLQPSFTVGGSWDASHPSNGTLLAVEFRGLQAAVLDPTPADAVIEAPAAVLAGAVDLSASPGEAVWDAPAPALALTLDLSASPAEAVWDSPAAVVEGALDLAGSPAEAIWDAPGASISSGVELAAAPSEIVLDAPAAALEVGAVLLAGPSAEAIWDAPAAALEAGSVLAPSPADTVWDAPAPALALSLDLSAGPAEAIWDAPAAVVSIGAGVELTAAPASVVWEAPQAAIPRVRAVTAQMALRASVSATPEVRAALRATINVR